MTAHCDVYLWHKASRERIGDLDLLGDNGAQFTFDQQWLDTGAPWPISLAVGHDITKADTQKLPPVFANLVAEERTVNRWFIEQKLAIKNVTSQSLLALSGANLIGGLEIHCNDDRAIGNQDISAANLPGVQPKLSGNRSLLLPHQDAFGPCLIKFPNHEFPGVVQVEFGCLSLAQMMGLDVPAVDLVPISDLPEARSFNLSNEQTGLRIQRFDRFIDSEGRLHCEDFAQVFGIQPENKYKQISQAKILEVIEDHCPQDTREYIQRLVFAVLIGNGDMHLKNWSLYYPQGHSPRLSPAYDYLSTILYLPQDSFALPLVKHKAYSKLDRREFVALGGVVGMNPDLIDDLLSGFVRQFCDAWRLAKFEYFNPDQVQTLDAHIAYHPLVQHFAADLAPNG